MTDEIKVGDRVTVIPRDSHPSWMKEIAKFDPMKATVLQISGDRALIEDKMGDEPFWVDVERLRHTEF